MQKTLSALALISLALYGGCSRGPAYEIVPVQGSVAFADGKKVPSGTEVLLSPTDGASAAAVAVVDEDGNFTVNHAATGKVGAEVGTYILTLRSPAGQEESFYQNVPELYHSDGVVTKISSDSSTIELKLEEADDDY